MPPITGMTLTGFLCPIDGLTLLGIGGELLSPAGRNTDVGDHVHLDLEGTATCLSGHRWRILSGPLMLREV